MKRAAPVLFLSVFALPFAAAGASWAADAPKSNALLGKHDTNQPIVINADKFAADLNNKSATYTGNVVVTQGDIRMHADTMKVDTSGGKTVQNIHADGHVVVDSPASGTVVGDAGVYDVTAHTVLMSGKVVMTHGKDVMRGTRLTVNLDTGQATLGASNGATPGRVQGVFTPGTVN